MRIHALQHVPFEDIGSMAEDFHRRGYTVTTTHWYLGDEAPPLDTFEALIVMGGPMSVHDERQYPWLQTEKALISAAIAADKIILGICLGAQLIASACGAKVSRNLYREIGWFPLIPQHQSDPIAKALANIHAFHWHGETFELPKGATWLASSAACEHQAFRLGDKIVGLQCHLETTPASAAALIKYCAAELDGSQYVQSSKEIMQHHERFAQINKTMSAVLNTIFDSRS